MNKVVETKTDGNAHRRQCQHGGVQAGEVVRGGAKIAAKQIPFLFAHRADVLVRGVSSECFQPREAYSRAHTLTCR